MPTSHSIQARANSVNSIAFALCLLCGLALLGAPAWSSVRAAKPVTGPDPSVATVAIDTVVQQITADGTLVLASEDADAPPLEVRIPEGVQIRAQRKKDFEGRRKLDFADLRVGHRLRLTVLPAEKRLIGVTVLKIKAT